jgi:hypothetical protein
MVAEAIRRAHVAFNDPPWINAGGILHGPRPPNKRELSIAFTGLYRVWIDRRIGEVSKALAVAMAAAMQGDDRAEPLEQPPDLAAIRQTLRGRNLADSAPKTVASQVGKLLEIANTEAP